MKKIRSYCPHCGSGIAKRMEGEVLRDFCDQCRTYFYENPLPVVATILDVDRKILLVKRAKAPFKGSWCLPTGFAEAGESIEDAALRELSEETGVMGKIIRLLDVDSYKSRFYGDLLFLTFIVEQVGGRILRGDDSAEVRFFPIDQVPRLAFRPNTKAMDAYLKSKADYWAIVDAITIEEGRGLSRAIQKNILTERLVDVIAKHQKSIARNWIRDVTTNSSTSEYHHFDQAILLRFAQKILSQIVRWLGGLYDDSRIRNFYTKLGRERRQEDFTLSGTLSALSLTRKHIWDFALSRGVWQRAIDIYMAFELERRIVIFFDKAAFHVTRGFEELPRSENECVKNG